MYDSRPAGLRREAPTFWATELWLIYLTSKWTGAFSRCRCYNSLTTDTGAYMEGQFQPPKLTAVRRTSELWLTVQVSWYCLHL